MFQKFIVSQFKKPAGLFGMITSNIMIKEGRTQLQFGDFLKTPIINKDNDKIFCLNVIYFWDDIKDSFKKVLSPLKNGGAFHNDAKKFLFH